MSSIRVTNIEAKADASSPTINEKVKITKSGGDVMLQLDGAAVGITTIGINTTGSTFTVDRNQGVVFAGIVTSIGGFSGNLTGNVTGNVTGNINSTGVTTVTRLNIGTGTSISSPATNVLTLGTNNVESVRIDSSGRLGIGITNPSTIFHIRQPADSNGITISHATRIGKWRLEHSGVNSENFAFIQNNGTSDAASYVAGRDVHYWLTNGIERMYLSSSGNLGIGTNNPTARLQVNGSTAKTSADGAPIAFSSNDAANAFQLVFQRSASTDAVPVWSISSVEQGIAYRSLSLQPNGGNTLIGMGGGNLGVGTANPSYPLEVRGGNNNIITAKVTNGQYGGIQLLSEEGNDLTLGYARNTSNYGAQTTAGDFSVKTTAPRLHFPIGPGNANSVMILDSSGRVQMPSQPSGAWFLNVSAGGVRSVSIRKNIGNCISSVGGGNGSNGSVGRFTAPVAGAYLISLFASAVSSSSQCLMSVYGSWTSATNNVYATQEVFDCRVTRPPEDGGGWSQVFYFNATDYWEIDWYRPGAPTAYIDSGMTMYVTVHLLG